MIRSLSVLSLIALVGCSGGSDDTASNDNGGNGGSCDVSVKSTVPVANSVDAYYRANVEFELSDPDSTAMITTDIPGHQELGVDGVTVKWVLDAPLSPSTSYSATLDYCGGSVSLDFTTSALGTAISEPGSLVGNSYVLALSEARITEPAGIGSVLSGYLNTDILLGISGVTDTQLDIIGALGKTDANGNPVEPSAQDYCDPTIAFPPADFTNPYFQVGPQTTTISVAGYDVAIGDLQITGTIAEDGTYFDGGTLSGTIDTRPLAPLVDDSGDPNAICALAVNFGAECQPCPADGEPYCLTLVADQILAEQVDGLTLIPVGGNNCMDCMDPTDSTDLSDTCPVDPSM